MIYRWLARSCRFLVERLQEMEIVFSLMGNGEWDWSKWPFDNRLYFGMVVLSNGTRVETVVFARDDEQAKAEFLEIGKIVFFYNLGKLRDAAHLAYTQENK